MTAKERYEYAKEKYAQIAVDIDAAINKTSEIRVYMHCWQGDDFAGFDLK